MTEYIRLYRRISREEGARLRAIGMSTDQLGRHRGRSGASIDVGHVLAQFELQGGGCYWCGDALASPEIDHVQPVSVDGTNDSDNVVLACRSCNWRKRDRPAAEFIAERLEQGLPVTSAAQSRFDAELRVICEPSAPPPRRIPDGHAPDALKESFGFSVQERRAEMARFWARHLLECTQAMPGELCEALGLECGSTFAQGARCYLGLETALPDDDQPTAS